MRLCNDEVFGVCDVFDIRAWFFVPFGRRMRRPYIRLIPDP
jgi:hypothetical protein